MRIPGYVISIVILGLVPHLALSREGQACDDAQKYEEKRFGVEAKPLVLNHLWGRTAIQTPDGHVKPHELPERVCLSLFTADSHRFVSSTTISEDGRFDFGAVSPGSYRLIARAEALCTGNVAVVVARSVWHRKRRIVVYFTIAALDACTNADYDRN